MGAYSFNQNMNAPIRQPLSVHKRAKCGDKSSTVTVTQDDDDDYVVICRNTYPSYLTMMTMTTGDGPKLAQENTIHGGGICFGPVVPCHETRALHWVTLVLIQNSGRYHRIMAISPPGRIVSLLCVERAHSSGRPETPVVNELCS